MERKNRAAAEKINDWFMECLDQSGAFFVTTVVDGKPKTSPMRSHVLKDGTNYFWVRKTKKVFERMRANPLVELSGIVGRGAEYIRYYGRAVFLEEPELAKTILDQSRTTILKKLTGQGAEKRLAVFYLDQAVCERSTMAAVIETITEEK